MLWRKTGHLADHPAVVAGRTGLDLLRGYKALRGAPLPLKTNNRAKLPVSAGGPGVADQDGVGGCEGMAHRGGIGLRFALMGQPIAPPSGTGIYLGALLCSRAPGQMAIYDTGTTPSAILSGLHLWGCSSEASWGTPMTAADLYINPNDTSATPEMHEPHPEQLFGSRLMRLNGAHFVQTTGDEQLLDVMAALAGGFPVTIAIPASGSRFQSYKGGVLTAKDLTGPIDHAQCLIDYEWNGSDLSTAVFYDLNSWGEGWGESDIPGIGGGLARFDRTAVNQATDHLVLDIERAAS